MNSIDDGPVRVMVGSGCWTEEEARAFCDGLADRLAAVGHRACGQPKGYRRHMRLREPACDRCKQAWAAYQADWHAANDKTRLGEATRRRLRETR